MCFDDGDTGCAFYGIRKSYSMVEIYEVVFGCCFFFLMHFHNLEVSLGMSRVYICTKADRKAEKL